MPTILLKKSDTPGSVPGTANLTNLAGGAEVAVNTADKRMFSMTSASAVVELGTNPSSLTCADGSFVLLKAASASITNLTATSLVLSNLSIASANVTTLTSASATITNLLATTLTISGGTANGVLYLNASKLATSGSAITYNGTTFGVDSAAVFNDSGANVDFRVEGDTDANLIFADASADFVGIGTSTPATKLDVSGRAQFVNNGFNYVLVDSTASDSYFRLASAGTVKWYLRNNTANTNALEITPDAGSTTGLFLTQSGNLGIGTSSPAYKLDITSASDADLLQIKSTASANNTVLRLGISGNDAVINASGNSTGSLAFKTYGTERMRLDSSGNLGLGVTPSAWGSGINVFDVGTYGSLWYSGGFTGLSSNGYFNSGWKYKATAAASKYEQTAGTHAWYTAASGTAGNAITFTQAMTLDASGNLGIGTTSPLGKLHAKGTAAADTLYRLESVNNSYASKLLMSSTSSGDGGIRYGAGGTNLFDIFSYGDMRFFCGTANISGTVGDERMRIDSSGNLGIANTSPGSYDADMRNLVVGTSGATGISIISGTSSNGTLAFGDGTGAATYRGYVQYNHTSDYLVFGTAATERARITAAGNLGIGTTSPVYPLVVSAAGAQGLEFDATAVSSAPLIQAYNRSGAAYVQLTYSALQHVWQTSGTERARITSAGYLLVGTTSDSASSGEGIKFRPGQSAGIAEVSSFSTNANDSLDMYSTGSGSYRFYVDWGGTVHAVSTSIAAISDQRLKENIRDLDAGLDAIMALKPRKFDWKEGKGKDIKNDRGFIAQEFEQVFPDLIDTWKDPAPEGEEPYKSVRQDLIPVLVKAMQEQQAMIEELKAKVAALEAK